MSVSLPLPRVRAAAASLVPSPFHAGGLIDQHGRTAHDLRVSLTDQCNLRCTYCMPAAGLDWLSKPQLMTATEIARLVGLGVRQLGITQVRFTGGEPLLRHDLVDIVRQTKALGVEVSLTTNALGLRSRAAALQEAGLDRINVSLDSVRPESFAAITRRPFLPQVLAGIEAAKGLQKIKINAVLMRGVNDTQATEMLAWALEHGYELRFIEQMPLDADKQWTRTSMLTAADIRAQLAAQYDLRPDPSPRAGAPAQLWQVFPKGALSQDFLADAPASPSPKTPPAERPLGVVGIIASVTENFCADCRRTRLTAEGKVRSCLFSHEEIDLLTPLRAGATDEELSAIWRTAMWNKLAGHAVNSTDFQQPKRPMSAIGG